MNKRKLLALMLMSGMLGSGGFPVATQEDETPEQIKKKINLKKGLRLIEQGVKTFEIDGIKVRARNYKNALRKVNNIKLTKET